MRLKTQTRSYTGRHAVSGLKAKLPGLECFENQYPDYEIDLSFPEFTSMCPRTGLPDFGTLTIRYCPGRWVLETKSLKMYLNAYRNLGIFTENVVNRVLKDVARCAKPRWAVVEGVFSPRGGIGARITAAYGKPRTAKES